MPLDAKLRARLEQALGVVDDQGTHGPRLLDDAIRLWRRIATFLSMHLLVAGPELLDALELACFALQMPLRRAKTTTKGRPARATLRDRAEEAAELLVGVLGTEVEEELLDRTIRLLQEMPHRSPMLDEAKLLADAVNLDDFGTIGLILQAMQLARQGEGLAQLADGCEKRELYGYWEARLKDGFHFEPVRLIAQRRLDSARQLCRLLTTELREDAP